MRSRIEFVQSQRLPWQLHDLWGLRQGVELKTLSIDDETEASSLLVRYPPKFSGPTGALTVDEEFLVLGGSFNVNGRTYGHLTYGHWPAGFESSEFTSPNGAVVLTFFSGRPRRATYPTEYDARRLVEHVDAYSVPYTGNFHPQFPPGAGRKKLYLDPNTQDTSWVLGTLPLRWADAAEVHPTVEEMYLISGETHGDRGVMRPGAYFWRPADAPHGPYGTLTGNLYFFRTKGGALSTQYVGPEKPFRWWPKYDPVIPQHLAAYAGEVSPAPLCW